MNKMSEVFNGQLTFNIDLSELKDERVPAFSADGFRAAIHAINSHDALTERVKVLEVAGNNLADAICMNGGQGARAAVTKWDKVLKANK